ncbi:MAG: DUF4292 domain-containing protein [Ignavibacteria bacterium]|nr:DUF4292 domain-containing protein [Ignavibacteria bacterium]
MLLLLFVCLVIFNYNLFPQEQIEKGYEEVNFNSLPQLIEVKGRINFALPKLNFSAQFEARIVAEDSAVLSVFGPMGVLLAKAFSNNENFVYYDVFNNWAVIGTPTREKIFKAARVPLGFRDFVRLFKGQLIHPIDSMRNKKLDDNRVLYSYKSGDFVDFSLCNNDSLLIQFQKKNLDDKVVLNISYPEYFSKDGKKFPKKYILEIEERNGTVSLDVEKINFGFDLTNPFSFSVPKTVEIFEYK